MLILHKHKSQPELYTGIIASKPSLHCA